MLAHRVITFIGDDRPGLIESLAAVVSAHEGNWLESRMSNLAGKFAGIVRVALPAQRTAEFERAAQALGNIGLTLIIQDTRPAETSASAQPYQLEIIGNDRPGIVREISAALARRHINVFDMRSDITSAPMSADPLFTASAEIHVPRDIDLDELRERLEAIADELMIDYTLVAITR
jgi:glycine cleavage system regulatory protein